MPLPDLPFLLTILSPNSSRLKTMLHPTGPIILQVLSSVEGPLGNSFVSYFSVLLSLNSSQTGSLIRTEADSDIFTRVSIPNT